MSKSKLNGYFQVVVYQADGKLSEVRKYKTLNRAYDFKNMQLSYGYSSTVKFVSLNSY